MLKRKRDIIIILIILAFFGHNNKSGGSAQDLYNAISDVPDSKWNELALKKIYFGHRSVGNNIMDGVKDIINENQQIRLKILKPNDTLKSDY